MSSIFTSTSVFYNLTLSYVISNCRSLIFIFIWCFSFIFVSFFAYCSLNSTNFFFTKIAIAFFILVNSPFGNLFSFLSYITAISIALFLHNIFYFPTLFWCPLFYFSLIFFFLEKLLIFTPISHFIPCIVEIFLIPILSSQRCIQAYQHTKLFARETLFSTNDEHRNWNWKRILRNIYNGLDSRQKRFWRKWPLVTTRLATKSTCCRQEVVGLKGQLVA